MDTNIDKSPKGVTSPGSAGASRAPGDIRSPGLSPDKPALTGSLQDKVGSAGLLISTATGTFPRQGRI